MIPRGRSKGDHFHLARESTRPTRHETGPSTTFKPLTSTTASNAKRKPQVESLRFFIKRGHGRGYQAKRSRWASFVADIPSDRLGTGKRILSAP